MDENHIVNCMTIFCRSDHNCCINLTGKFNLSCLCHLEWSALSTNERLYFLKTTPVQHLVPSMGHRSSSGSVPVDMVVFECLISSTQWIPLGTGISSVCRVDWWVTVMRGFLSMCCISKFGDGFLSRLLVFGLCSGLISSMCGGALAVSWRANIVQSWTVDSFGNLLLLACTLAFCTLRVGGSGIIPIFISGDLERPLNNSTQEIQFRTPWPVGVSFLKMQICWCGA